MPSYCTCIELRQEHEAARNESCFRLATALFQRKPSKKRKKRREDEHRKLYIAKGVRRSWTRSPS